MYKVEELDSKAKPQSLDISRLNVTIATGGEADAYLDVPNTIFPGLFLDTPRLVVKIYKTPEHKSFAGDTKAQESTRKRLLEHQTKLVEIPRVDHEYLVPHCGLVRDARGDICGIILEFIPDTVPLLQFLDPMFRENQVPDYQYLIDLILKINEGKEALHAEGVALSDLNWMNILVEQLIQSGIKVAIPHNIDLDSASYKQYQSILFTMRLVDPAFCDPNAKRPILVKPRDFLADDYALLCMTLEMLLGVGPWDGKYKPKDRANKVMAPRRPLERISVWHADVGYPDPMIAMPLSHLPDEFAEHCIKVFEDGERLPFPKEMLMSMIWNKCTECGHAYSGHSSCPSCTSSVSVPMISVALVREVLEQYLAQAEQDTKIVHWQVDTDKVRYVYARNGNLYREDGKLVGPESSTGREVIVCLGDVTYIARGQVVDTYGAERFNQTVGTYMGIPVITEFQGKLHWISPNGDLMKMGMFGAEKINEKKLVPFNTNFLCGKNFGYIYYQSGALEYAYIVNSDGSFQPAVAPDLVSNTGQVVMGRIEAVFSSSYLWFMWTHNHGNGELRNHCMVLDVAGRKVAEDSASVNDYDHWLSHLHGKTATGNVLFSTLRDGSIVKLELRTTTKENVFDIKTVDTIEEASEVIRPGDELQFTRKGIVAGNSAGVRLLTVQEVNK